MSKINLIYYPQYSAIPIRPDIDENNYSNTSQFSVGYFYLWPLKESVWYYQGLDKSVCLASFHPQHSEGLTFKGLFNNSQYQKYDLFENVPKDQIESLKLALVSDIDSMKYAWQVIKNYNQLEE